MDITCVSDLHGYYPELHGGDLLIVAGDLTACDDYIGYRNFNEWMLKNSRIYKKSIVIAGNHDNGLLPGMFNVEFLPKVAYLCDSGTEFEGLKIWGSPWTKAFKGMHLACKAFTVDTDEELAEKFKLIPDDTDILITHEPPHLILDKIKPQVMPRIDSMLHVGSPSLRETIERIKPRLHVCGHIHENGGQQLLLKHEGPNTICVNASYVDERYAPVNKPVRVIL